MRSHKAICSNADYYIDDKEYQTFCGGSTKSSEKGKRNYLLSKLEYLVYEEMRLIRLDPLSLADINIYWKDRL